MSPQNLPRQLPPTEVARAIRRMRIIDRLLMFAAVLLMLLGMWWADLRFEGRTQPVVVTTVVIVTICAGLIVAFVPFRCPCCGHRLWVSGRFSLGSLDRDHCENCGVSFRRDKTK